MKKEDLEKLSHLGRMVLDLGLARLQQAKAAREETLRQIAALQAGIVDEGISEIAAHQAALRYQAWADLRRRELNLILARQTVAQLTAEDEARLALGRVDVLQRIRRR